MSEEYIWQPIATAPKNGDKFLALFPIKMDWAKSYGPNIYVCWYDDKQPLFWCAINGGLFRPCIQPTHWFPMPTSNGSI